jgi:hypothetical protein
MTFQLHVFFIVIIGTFLISAITFRKVKGYWQRFLWMGLISGVFIYSGVGAAYREVPRAYLLYYFGFILSLSISFFFFVAVLGGMSRKAGNVLNQALSGIDRQRGWNIIIFASLFFYFIPLLYPEFRLHEFFNPHFPDLQTAFMERFQVAEINIFLKLIDYLRILIAPFFFIALYKHRKSMKKVILVLLLLLYIQYVNQSYIGRSTVGMTILLIFISLWVIHPAYRSRLIAIGIALVPLGLAGSYLYGIIRIGGQIYTFDFWNSVFEMIYAETSFPIQVGTPIIESGQRGDLLDYFKWIITLPIPKLLTGEIAGARINYEISEVILLTSTGGQGWYVVLPGLVAESVYIYGRSFFWLHGVFVGFIAAVTVRLVERCPQLLFLVAHLVVLFFYVLNRGGIAALLPNIVNQFLLFYVFILMMLFNPFRKQGLLEI